MGGNVGAAADTLLSAVEHLRELTHGGRVEVSPFYRTAPVGFRAQDDFINAVAAFDTDIAPLDLMHRLQQIERRHGRLPSGVRWGPRELDLDILLYGDEVITTDDLQIPHPRMHERLFVLRPLTDLARGATIPGHGAALDCMRQCAGQGIERIETPA